MTTGETTMRRAVLLCTAAVLALAGCGGATDTETDDATSAAPSTAGPAALDGTETYRDPGELVDALAERGTDCSGLTAGTSTYAAAQARCYAAGNEVVIQLWLSSSDRDARVTEQIGLLSGAGLGYCYVLGRKSTGTWSVNAGTDATLCQDVADSLGGEKFDG